MLSDSNNETDCIECLIGETGSSVLPNSLLDKGKTSITVCLQLWANSHRGNLMGELKTKWPYLSAEQCEDIIQDLLVYCEENGEKAFPERTIFLLRKHLHRQAIKWWRHEHTLGRGGKIEIVNLDVCHADFFDPRNLIPAQLWSLLDEKQMKIEHVDVTKIDDWLVADTSPSAFRIVQAKDELDWVFRVSETLPNRKQRILARTIERMSLGQSISKLVDKEIYFWMTIPEQLYFHPKDKIKYTQEVIDFKAIKEIGRTKGLWTKALNDLRALED